MIDDIPALEPSLSHKSSLLAKVRRQQIAKNLPDYIFSGLAALGCSDKEISTLTRCNPDDLKDKAQPIAEGKARLKHALRKAQLKAALKGNPSLLIWLGKIYLGQSDQPSQAHQHTNIVVTADLLSNLQQSYQSTLSDIRRNKAVEPLVNANDLYRNPNPFSPPVLAQLSYESPASEAQRGTISEPTEPDPTQSPEASQPTEPQSVTCDITPITSDNTASIQSHNSLRENERSDDSEPRPPGVPPPTQTPTPTPKRPQSLLSENFEDASDCAGKAQPKRAISHGSGKLGNGKYGAGELASRWNGRLKRIKGTRGGSRTGGTQLKAE